MDRAQSSPGLSETGAKKPSRFLLLWFLFRAMHVSPSVEESSNPEDDQVDVANNVSAVDDDPYAKVKLPKKLPSIIEIKRVIPSHCFESNTLLSIYYVIKDFVIIASLIMLAEWTWAVLPPATQLVITPLYWLVQGTVFTGVFFLGHDCGHGSFSKYEIINTIFGNICHNFVICPYYQWKITHRNHHQYTGNMDKDEVFYPVAKKELTPGGVPIVPCFGFGIGWFAYLIKGYDPRGVPHFNPLHPMFRKHVINCTISLVHLTMWVMCLVRLQELYGLGTVIYHWGVPTFIFASYMVVITFLQHTEDDIPWYSNETWDYVRGQLSTIDRSYGWSNWFIHSVNTHQIHHLFTKIPHYHLLEATKAFRKAFPELVHICDESILPAFVRMFKKYVKQNVVEVKPHVFLYQ